MKVKQAKKNMKQFSAKAIAQKQMHTLSGGKSKSIIEDDIHGV